MLEKLDLDVMTSRESAANEVGWREVMWLV